MGASLRAGASAVGGTGVACLPVFRLVCAAGGSGGAVSAADAACRAGSGARSASRRACSLSVSVSWRACSLAPSVFCRACARPGGGGAEVPAGPCMHLAQLPQLAVADAGALGEKPLEYPGTGPEGRGLLHQHAVAVQGLAEGRAERDGIALVPDTRAEVVPGGQNFGPLGREGVDGSAVAPARDRVADLACDPDQRVVVRGGGGVGRAGLGRAGLAHAVRAGPAVRLPGIAPRAVRDVVERRLLGL